MRYLLTLGIVLFVTFYAQAQFTANFQARVEELYSEALQSNGTPDVVWKFQTRFNEEAWNNGNECFSRFGSSWTWYNDFNSNSNSVGNRVLRTRTIYSPGTNFQFQFEGHEEDKGTFCHAGDGDDHKCGWDEAPALAIDYSLTAGYAGRWVSQQRRDIDEMWFCDGKYRTRLAYFLAPPALNSSFLEIRKDGHVETKFCGGDQVNLVVTHLPSTLTHSEELEYIWEYRLNDEERVVDYICTQYEWVTGPCEEFPQPATASPMLLPPPGDGDCRMCVEWQPITEDYWRYAITTSDMSVSIPAPAAGNRVQYRVTVRNKYTGERGTPGGGTPYVFIYDPQPALASVPAVDDVTVDNVAEATYTGPSIDIQHVKCAGQSTGKIIIKNVVGNGRYYFSLKRSDGNIVMNIDGNMAGTPSDSNPAVFPDDSYNNGGRTGLPAGLYTVMIENLEDPGRGTEQRLCFASYPIYIKEPGAPVNATPLPIAKGSGNPYAISCYGAGDGEVRITGAGGIGPYTYGLTDFTSQNSSGPVVFSGLTNSKSYSLTVTDALSCSITPQTIANLSQPPQLTLGTPQLELFGNSNEYNISCHGGTGKVTLYTQGDATLSRKAWVVNGPSDNTVTNDTDPIEFDLGVGPHKIIASYQFGCTDTVDVSLAEPNALQVTKVDAQHASCLAGAGDNDADGYITLSASGGIVKPSEKYSMALTSAPNDGKEGSPVTFNNLQSGSYSVVVRDSYCSETIYNLEIPKNPNPVSFLGAITIVEPSCNEYTNGTITVVGDGGFPFTGDLYEFSIEGVKKTGQFASTTFNQGIGKGTYTLTVEDSKGCTADTVVTVNEPFAIANLFSQKNNICRGDEVAEITGSLSGGTGPYTVQWKNSLDQPLKSETVASTTRITALPAGNYFLQIKDSRGCANSPDDEWYTVSREIIDPDTLKLSPFLVDHITCYEANDGYVSLSATGGWITSYRYSSDSMTYKSSNEFTGLKPGLNKFYVMDAGGCVAVTKQVIQEPTVLEAALDSVKDAQCFGFANGWVRLNLKGGRTPYSVTSAANVSWEEGNTAHNLKAGSYTISVRDSSGCPQAVTAVVGEPTELLLKETANVSSTCSVDNGQGAVLASGGMGSYQYRWYNSGGQLVGTDAEEKALFADAYHVETEDANHCITPLQVLISDVGGARIDTWDITDATCSYSDDGAIDITITNGTQPFAITWNDPNASTTEDISKLFAKDYQVQIVDGNNCKLFKKFTVGSPDPLDVVVTDLKLPTCFQASDAFVEVDFAGGNGGYTYYWFNRAEGTRLENLSAGDYGIKIVDQKGCEYEEIINIADPPKFVLGLTDKTICAGQQHVVDLGVEGTYTWTSTNGFESSNRQESLTEPGRYFVKVVDINGCIAEENFELKTSADLLVADFLVIQDAAVGDTVVVVDISWPLPEGITWQFDPTVAQVLYAGQDYAEVIYNTPGTYPISLTAALGDCRDTQEQWITIMGGGKDNSAGREGDPLVQQFEVYPNPNDGQFFVEVGLREPLPIRIRLISLSGNRTLVDQLLEGHTQYLHEVVLRSYSSGSYILLLEVAGKKLNKQIIIK